jgi:hypothetical protein
VVVLDSDTRDCRQFLGELDAILQHVTPRPEPCFASPSRRWRLGTSAIARR